MTTVTKDQPRLCSDQDHDDRWCATCEAMWDGARLALVFVSAPQAFDGVLARFAVWAGNLAARHRAESTDVGETGSE